MFDNGHQIQTANGKSSANQFRKKQRLANLILPIVAAALFSNLWAVKDLTAQDTTGPSESARESSEEQKDVLISRLNSSDSSASDRLTDTYALANLAKSQDELEVVLESCLKLREHSLTEEQRNHAVRLTAWANFRLGEVSIDQAVTAFQTEADASVDPQEEYLDRAQSYYNAALKDDASLGHAKNGLGVVHSMRGEFENAIDEFRAAVELSPNLAQAHFNLGECLLLIEDSAGAIAAYSAGIDCRPQDPAGYAGRAHAYMAAGEIRTAILDYRRCVQLEPNNTNALLNRGDAYSLVGEWSKAIDDYREALTQRGDEGVVAQRLAWLMATCPDVRYRNEPAAYELALNAIEKQGKANAVTLDTLAAAQASNGWFDDAVQSLDLAEELSPDLFTDEMAERKKIYQAKNPYLIKPR